MLLMLLLYNEFAYFRVAITVGEVNYIDARRQVEVEGGLVVGHRLSV